MAEFHFVEDYERLVDELVAAYPFDEAMQLAVGGSFEKMGAIEVEVLRQAGLRDGMRLMDLGCGSGRLATALGSAGLQIEYAGTDIVQRLLDYAATISPKHYVFTLHRALSVPADNESLDMVSAFSLFTHLLHHETYLYLEDSCRALRRGGRIVFSFLEFARPKHWNVFTTTLGQVRSGSLHHLNSFIERLAIEKWARELGLRIVSLEPEDVEHGTSRLGQSIAILEK